MIASDAEADSAPRAVYAPADFARFAPRSALDMARQVPGFPIDDGDGERGFGQADTNILINGRRISGKSNGPVAALGRIPADDVARLEVVDGASLDIGGLSGQVLNVVTLAGGGISGRYRYSPEGRTDRAPGRWRNGAFSLSGGGAATEWTLDISNDESVGGTFGPEFVFDGDGALIDRREEALIDVIDQPGLAGSLTRVMSGGTVLNLSGEVNWFLFDSEEVSRQFPVGESPRVRELVRTEDEFNFEVGADLDFSLGPGRLKLIGLHRFEDSPTENRVRFDFEDGRPSSGSVFERQADEAETVLRAEFTHAALGGDWQWALEGTHNYLDIESELLVRNELGELEPSPLPGASSRVEEDRAEFTLSYSHAWTPAVQVQYSLGAEFSELRQSGEFGLTREFVRPKGFVSVNWSAAPGRDIALQLERRVGQLNFFDFIASVNVNQDRVNVTNVNLVPPQSWLLDLQLQQALGDLGSLTLGAFFEDITDSVDLIPIEGGGQAPGNLDEAVRYGVSTNATLLSDPAGWRGLRLDLEAAYTKSEVDDPLTGETRPLSNDSFIDFEATLRQDFPGTAWAAGIQWFFDKARRAVRIDEISVFKPSRAFTRLFVEHKDVFGLTLRGSVANLNDRGGDFFRTIFNDRTTNDVAFREARYRDFGLLIRFEIEGSF
ncbi:MAG: TonB-dependent receptor plug domain-containing protein [Pseudomonadota bacterium]